MGSSLRTIGEELQVTLAGSIISIPDDSRAAAAVGLHRNGYWVHLDVIDGPFGSRPSITIEQIEWIVEQRTGPVDVHLMVGDISAWIDRLPMSLDRITVQISPTDYRAEASPSWIIAARTRAAEVWIAVDPLADGAGNLLLDATELTLHRGVDGVLVMLVPPGQSGYEMDEERLAFAHQAGAIVEIPVGVDGGVNVSNLERITATGVTYAVSGRGLFEPSTQFASTMEAGQL